MKMMVAVALALVAVAAAAPATQELPTIEKYIYDRSEKTYNFGFKTSDGTERKEEAQLKQVLDEDQIPHEVYEVRGSYTYVNPDGQEETVEYVANETGFHPVGKSIPVAPEVAPLVKQ